MIKKKVIIIGPSFPLRGGIADSNHSLGFALQKLGCEVKMLSFSLQYPSILFPGKTQLDTNASKPNLSIFSKINSINPLSWIKVAFWLKKQKPDLIITRFWIPFIGISLGSILRLFGLNNNTDLIALCDNVIPHEKRFGDYFFTRYFLKSNNRFLVMSKSVGNDISTFIKNPTVDYHPHPVYDHFGNLIDKSQAISDLSLDVSKKYLLFFGFIRKYKGLDLLLDAMPNFTENVELIVAGEFYDHESEYKVQVSKLGIENKVHFFSDFIPENKVNLFFSACDMVVQPYKSATQSGVAQIAYHFNKPILVTNVGGLPEIVPHKKVGYVVNVSSKAISEAVNDFYSHNRELYFIDNVKIEKHKYSWSNMATQILKSD